MGLTSVHPCTRQVFVSQPIEPSGSFPRALAGLVGTRHPRLGNMKKIWGESSAHSNLQSEFDVSQVANWPEDRAVDPGASGKCYLNNGSASDSVAVTRADTYTQGNHGVRPKTTIESQQMDPAGMETGSTGLLPVQEHLCRAPVRWRWGMSYPITFGNPVCPVDRTSSTP